MEIKLDGDAMVAVASKAIFESMDSAKRDEVLKQAVASLLTPVDTRGYGAGFGKTPLQSAFEQAIRDAAFKAVRERIAEDPQVQAAIEELMGPLLNSAMKSEGKEFSSSLADALGSALGSWLAERARTSE